MKTIKFLFNVSLLVFLPFACLHSQTFNEGEKVVKSFALSSETQVEVNNKYGKVYVKTWKKDSIRFEIDLNISSNSLTRLHKLKNSIRFDFTNSKYYITVSTDFGSAGNQIYAELKNLTDAITPGKNSLEVNYTIYCPESVNLTLINKFGDIYIDDLRGDININLANGDLKINSISGESKIELNFGNGIINHLDDGDISVSYSDMKVRSAEKLSVTSKSSSLNIDNVNLLKLNSRRDKYFIEKAHSLFTIADFSQIWLENLGCDADLNLKFGSFSIDNIGPELCKMNIASEYADITLNFMKDVNFEADITHQKDVVLNIPNKFIQPENSKKKLSEDELYTWFETSSSSNLPLVKIKATQKCYVNMIVKQ